MFYDERAQFYFVEGDPWGDDADSHADLGHFLDGGHGGEFHGGLEGDVVMLEE